MTDSVKGGDILYPTDVTFVWRQKGTLFTSPFFIDIKSIGLTYNIPKLLDKYVRILVP